MEKQVSVHDLCHMDAHTEISQEWRGLFVCSFVWVHVVHVHAEILQEICCIFLHS